MWPHSDWRCFPASCSLGSLCNALPPCCGSTQKGIVEPHISHSLGSLCDATTWGPSPISMMVYLALCSVRWPKTPCWGSLIPHYIAKCFRPEYMPTIEAAWPTSYIPSTNFFYTYWAAGPWQGPSLAVRVAFRWQNQASLARDANIRP